MDKGNDEKPLVTWLVFAVKDELCYCESCESLTCGISFHDHEFMKLAPAEVYTLMAERAMEALEGFLRSETAKHYPPPRAIDVNHIYYIVRRKIIIQLSFFVVRDTESDFPGGYIIETHKNYHETLRYLTAQMQKIWN